MNSSDSVRGLLSQKRKAVGGGDSALSGKDKVALLKKMREKQKDTTREGESDEKKPKTVDSSSTAANRTTLPNNFFDNQSVPTKQVVPATSTVKSADTSEKSTSNGHGSLAAPAAALPKGFFDNPFDDSKARGIDLMKVIETKDKEANIQLKSFLSELNETNELQEEADENDEIVREEENEAIQMSYMVRYAGLLAKATHMETATPELLQEGIAMSKVLLPVVEENESELGQTQVDTTDLSNSDSIEAIMRAKRKQKKEQKKLSQAQEYIPIDASDWTSRYV